MEERLFKCLSKKRIGCFSRLRWPKCGVWVEAKGELIPCENGIHLCRESDLIYWLDTEIYEAEYDGGERIEANGKIVVRKARLIKKLKTWNKRTMGLFFNDCFTHVLSKPRGAYLFKLAALSTSYILPSYILPEEDTWGKILFLDLACIISYKEKQWQTKRLMEYLYPDK